MITDAVVLGLTIWKTFYIFKVEKETTVGLSVTKVLAYNGNTILQLIPSH